MLRLGLPFVAFVTILLFRGKNAAELMSGILRDTPQPITALQPAAPPQLDRIVARCLERDPAAR